MSSGSAGSTGLTPGSVVAGLRVEERIGAGGMAAVFRAYDDRLRRRVALKVLDPARTADGRFQRRFIRESRAAAAVEDPHIIPIYDAGESDGVLFIAMRYVAGGDLRSLLAREGPLPAATVAEFVSQTASALDAAHRAGLVHRDVKPGNMLIDKRVDGAPGHIYLSDFGLSKPSLVSYQLTPAGQLLGTPAYIAPEQLKETDVDGRADQYALACAAFELLAGDPPFDRRKGIALVRAHLTEPPPPVTSRRAGLPSAADRVLARALAKVPDGRYRTCREFARELAVALAGAGSSAPVPSAAQSSAPAPSVASPPSAAMAVTQEWTPYGAPTQATSFDRQRTGPAPGSGQDGSGRDGASGD